MSALEFRYWLEFFQLESGEEKEPEPMSAEQQLAFMRGIANG